MKEELKALSSIHLDIFKYSIVSQAVIDRLNQQAAKEAEQAAKLIAKEAAKQLTISRREAKKDYDRTCKAFRNLLDVGIFELQSFRSSPKKSPRKSPQKIDNQVLNTSYLPPPQLPSSHLPPPQLPPSQLPPPSPPPSPTRSRNERRKAPQRKATTRTFAIEEEETPIQARVSRTGRTLRPTQRRYLT
jgi:hypothetical protein